MTFNNLVKTILEKIDLKGTKPSDYNQKTLKKGQKVEKEHSDNPKVAQRIAQQHIAEFPLQDKNKKIDSEYYDELDNTEKKLKKSLTKSFDKIVKDLHKEISESQTLIENLAEQGWFIIDGKAIDVESLHAEYVRKYIQRTKKDAGIPVTEEERRILLKMDDPIAYALKLGWIRIRFYDKAILVEMQTLTSETLKQLVDGLWEIQPNIQEKQLILLDIISPKRTTYAGVPFEVLQSGEMDRLNYYRTSRPYSESQKIQLENNTAGSGGVFGTSQANPNPQFSSDWYAPGDSRNIWGNGKTKSKKSKKCKSCKNKAMLMPMARRTMK